MDQQNKSSIGSIIGTIIIIAIIILGGLYFWGKRIEESKAKQKLISDSVTTTTPNEITDETGAKSVSSSDDLDSIENDLNNTSLEISSELNAPLE